MWIDRRRPAAAAAGAGLLTVAVVVVAAALALRPAVAPAASDAVASHAAATASPPAASPSPVLSSTADGSFRFELAIPSSHYTTNDEIDPIAALTWIGADATRTVFHAASPILFRIDEVAGTRVMDGGRDLPCLSTVFTSGAGKPYPFQKSGSPTDDPAAGFDRTWYEEPVLRLPAGQWRIMAQLDAYLGGCGGDAERHQLTVSAELTVIPVNPSNEPVSASKDDGTLRLTLTTPRGIFGPNDAIEPIATVSYLGPDAETTIYTGDPPVVFSIQELGGGRRMDGSQKVPCIHTRVDQAAPLTFPFAKSGVMTSFDRAWFDERVLRLPVGTWRIRATLNADTTDGTDTCGGIPHNFDVDNVIEVVGHTPDASAPATASPAPTPAPASPELSADAAVALELVRKFEDGLRTGHTGVSWGFLSSWSQASVGAEFEALYAMAAPPALPLEIGSPDQDPDLLSRPFLGP
jgi:hypothetical protein